MSRKNRPGFYAQLPKKTIKRINEVANASQPRIPQWKALEIIIARDEKACATATHPVELE